MHQDDDHNRFIEDSPSISQGSVPDPEDEMIEDEIGGLMDQLTEDSESEEDK
jgi:hypothetical protein